MKKSIFLMLAAIAFAVAAAFAYRYFVLVKPLRLAVLDQLKDPDSAQFRRVRYFGDWTVQGGFLCGEVNAKNAMGGYVGFRPFHATSQTAIIESEVVAEAYASRNFDPCDLSGDAKWWHLR